MRFAEAFNPFRSFEAAWKLLKQAPGVVMIGGLLLAVFCSDAGGPLLRFSFRGRSHGHGARELLELVWPWVLVSVPLVGCIGLVFFLVSSFLLPGYARAIERGLHTGRDDVGLVFEGGERALTLMLARILRWLIDAAAFAPVVGALALSFALADGRELPRWMLAIGLSCFALAWGLVYLYVRLGLALVVPIVVFEDCSAASAIARSWKLADGHRLQLLVFALVEIVAAVLGLCLCLVGALLTVPLVQVMRFEAYLALSRGEEYPRWWIACGRSPLDVPPIPSPLPPQA